MRSILTLSLMILTLPIFARAEDAKPKPDAPQADAPKPDAPKVDAPKADAAPIDSTDKAALEAALDKTVTITGTIKKAAWSNSGKVMTIEFEKSNLLGAVFERNRADIDKAFEGNAAKALSGAKVTVTGKLAKYGGKAKTFEGKPQIIIDKAEQVKIDKAK